MRNIILTLILFFSSQHFVQAQIQLSDELKEAIRAALQKDVNINNNQLEKQRMELEHKSILAKYIPKVEANALYAHFNSDVTIDLPTAQLPLTGHTLFEGNTLLSNKGNAFYGGVMAKAVLFSGGQIYNGARALEEKNRGTAFLMENRQDEVIKSLIESYDQLQLLKGAEQLIQQSEKRLQKESHRIERAISAGLAIPYDRDKIKLATLELASKKQDVYAKQQLLALKIAQETNLDTAAILHVAYRVDPWLVVESGDNVERNEIQALKSFKKASEYAIKKEKGSFLPTLGAFGGYNYSSLFNTNTNIPLSTLQTTANLKLNKLELHPTWMVGLGLKWEIFSGFERKHKIEEARINQRVIENKLHDAQEKFDLLHEKNKTEYNNTLTQVSLASQKEKVAENNHALAEKQYQAGLISITDRLAAENDLYEASLGRLQKIALQRKAAIETYASAGILASLIQTTLDNHETR